MLPGKHDNMNIRGFRLDMILVIEKSIPHLLAFRSDGIYNRKEIG